MTDNITRSLKERPKLTKSYHKNSQQKSDKLLEKSADCTTKITETKNDSINQMTDKPQDPSAAILRRLLYNKKISSNTTTIG